MSKIHATDHRRLFSQTGTTKRPASKVWLQKVRLRKVGLQKVPDTKGSATEGPGHQTSGHKTSDMDIWIEKIRNISNFNILQFRSHFKIAEFMLDIHVPLEVYMAERNKHYLG
jgi:hypothetical protein